MKALLAPARRQSRQPAKLPTERQRLRVAFCAWRASLPAGLERDTLLMPWLIADNVCHEVTRFLDVQLPARYPVWLAAKAERCYVGNRRYHKLMLGGGNSGRDWLYAHMRHWLASLLQLERPDLMRLLPVDFSNGHRLPPRPNHGFRPPSRQWDDARVTRHARWAWLKQVALASGDVGRDVSPKRLRTLPKGVLIQMTKLPHHLANAYG